MLDYGIDGGMSGICGTNGAKFKARIMNYVLDMGPDIVDQTGPGDQGALDWRALNEGGFCVADISVLADRPMVSAGDLSGTATFVSDSVSGMTLGPYLARVKRFRLNRSIAGPNRLEGRVHILLGSLVASGTFQTAPDVFVTQVTDDGSSKATFNFDTAATVASAATGLQVSVDGVTWLTAASSALVGSAVQMTYSTIGPYIAWKIASAAGITFGTTGGNVVDGNGAVG
jgi:hypothetical protein